jgi:lipopolysaccharide/colanic/teichoic acid biosynthesis glycosyltransferase
VTSPEAPLPPFGRRAGDIKPLAWRHLAVRRCLDIVVALVSLLVLLPVMVVTALLVLATSRGGVFYRHERVGRYGKLFSVLKFRTMRVGANAELLSDEAAREEYVANNFKMREDDPRITWVGRILRRTSLDELPQLWNVLRGDMSVVGVRPLVPEELAARPEIDRELYCRLRPGITGLWQTSGRSNVVENQRIVLDRSYAAHWHPLHDVRILTKTPLSVMRLDESR